MRCAVNVCIENERCKLSKCWLRSPNTLNQKTKSWMKDNIKPLSYSPLKLKSVQPISMPKQQDPTYADSKSHKIPPLFLADMCLAKSSLFQPSKRYKNRKVQEHPANNYSNIISQSSFPNAWMNTTVEEESLGNGGPRWPQTTSAERDAKCNRLNHLQPPTHQP